MSIKNKHNTDKIIIKSSTGTAPEEIGFSFKHLTTNSDYNFSYFSKSKNECLKSKASLYDRIEEITKSPWIHWHNLSKFNGGIETLPASSIKFRPDKYVFSDGDKVIVFRFNSDKCRIIGFKTESSSNYYVIGFDFDYSAYNHGS